MTQILLTLAPHGASAWSRLREQLLAIAELLLNARMIMHGLLVFHLSWEVAKMLGAGDMFAVDPHQYSGLLRTGGERFWGPFLGVGAVFGGAGLVTGKRYLRAASAGVIAVVEWVFVHYLTISGAAPTAGPTYNILILIAGWLAFAHWFPDGPLARRAFR